MDSFAVFHSIPIGMCGAALFAIGLFLWQRAHSFLATGLHAQATVVDYREVPAYRSKSCTYAPIIEFTTREGNPIRTTLNWSSNPPRYHKGAVVPILYNPELPTTAEIHSSWLLTIIPRSLTALGAAGMLYSIVSLFLDL